MRDIVVLWACQSIAGPQRILQVVCLLEYRKLLDRQGLWTLSTLSYAAVRDKRIKGPAHRHKLLATSQGQREEMQTDPDELRPVSPFLDTAPSWEQLQVAIDRRQGQLSIPVPDLEAVRRA